MNVENFDIRGIQALIEELMNPSDMTDVVDVDCPTKGGSDILSDIKHVIFNDPATIVTFKDGSRVCVKACAKDKFDKETGLVHAIVKRLYANDIDSNGYMKSTGLGEKIGKIIARSYDQKEHDKARRAKRREKLEKQKKMAALEKEANDAAEDAAKAAIDRVYGTEVDRK